MASYPSKHNATVQINYFKFLYFMIRVIWNTRGFSFDA